MAYKIGIIGSGSWATAILKMLNDNKAKKEIFWWIRKPESAEYIQRHKKNPQYLKTTKLKIKKDNVLTDAKEVIAKSEIVVLNTPAAYLKDALKGIQGKDLEGKIIVSAIKGIIPGENLVVGEYLMLKYGVKEEDLVIIAGPCHAEEVAKESLSYLTIASASREKAEIFSVLLQNKYIRTKISTDVFGIEHAAVMKNIYAIASGMCQGLGFGDNFQSILVSNAVREMEYFVNIMDNHPRNISDSAYLGDLLVTAYSQFSRNLIFGKMIGRGYTVQSAQLEMNMIAEGYFTVKNIHKHIEKEKLDMPICEAMYKILYQNKKAENVIGKLLEKLD